MIPRSTKGGSFAGALRYDLEKEGAVMLDTNCAGRSWQDIAKEMDTFAASSTSKKPALHTSLSLPSGVTMTPEQWRESTKIYLKEMGLENHQFVLTLHNDAKHQHVHLVINRVNERGRLADDSNDRHRSLAACRVVEKELGLTIIDKNYQKQNDGRFNDVKKDLAESITLSNSTEQLRAHLKARGYALILNESKTTGRISGASIQALSDKKTWKMSEIQKGGWRSVEKSLNKNAEKTTSQNPKEHGSGISSGSEHSRKQIIVTGDRISDSQIAAAFDEKEKAYLVHLAQLQHENELKKIQQRNMKLNRERER